MDSHQCQVIYQRLQLGFWNFIREYGVICLLGLRLSQDTTTHTLVKTWNLGQVAAHYVQGN